MRKYESTKTNQIHHFLSIFLMFSICSILLPPATAIPSPPDPFGGAGTRRGFPMGHPLLAGNEPTIQKLQFFAESLCRKFTAVSRVWWSWKTWWCWINGWTLRTWWLGSCKQILLKWRWPSSSSSSSTTTTTQPSRWAQQQPGRSILHVTSADQSKIVVFH